VRHLLVAPIAIPLATASLLLWSGRMAPARQHAVATAGTAALGVVALVLLADVIRHGILVLQIGGWPAPFGISFVADRLAVAMVAVTALVALAVVVYATAAPDAGRHPVGSAGLLQILLAGVCGSFLTGDVFNLYVWFEVMLIASFGLLALGGGRARLDAAVKYVALNLVATLLFLSGAGLLYGVTGTLNMADLHGRLQQAPQSGVVVVVAALFIVTFGIKAAMFPLFAWLPASYHTLPVPVSAFFAGLLTKVGVYALIRFFTLVFPRGALGLDELLVVLAGLTMVTGVLGAAAQSDFRRILSFHIVSQIGYMLMGLALGSVLALTAAVFYTLHHIVVKANLFLLSGVSRRLSGSFELARSGGLYRREPLVAAVFLVPAFSLAGFPPLSGFWAKLLLIQAGLELERWIVVGVLAAVGLLTTYSMTKIWAEAFWKPRPEDAGPAPAPLAGRERALLLGPVLALASLTLAIGLWPAPLFEFASGTAQELLAPDRYVTAVLGEAKP
jgi:multicomponent Na+:H+ antiporter subunit D